MNSKAHDDVTETAPKICHLASTLFINVPFQDLLWYMRLWC